ncbi:MAG: hypothetical protein ABIJ61_08565 [bacterium]
MNVWQRTLAVGILCLSLSMLALGATPELVNYQARLTEPDGEPINDTISLVFSIYSAATGGDLLWQESHSNVPVIDGLFEVILGAGTPAIALGSEIFASTDTWLGIQIGADPEMSPRTRLVAVPYSQRVNTIDEAEGGQVLGPVTISPTSDKQLIAEPGKLVIRGDADDSVTIAPGNDIVISGTNDNGEDVVLIVAGDDGGALQVTASDAAKATSRTVEIAPGQGVLLKGTEANGDDVVLITAGENGGEMLVTASDAAKGLVRTLRIAPGDGVLIQGTEANGDDVVLITAGENGGALQVTASDAAKGTSRTVSIDPAQNVILRATEANDDEVVLITANETGGTIQVTASDAAKADPNSIVGTVIINENGIFIVNDETSDTTLAITSDGDIVGDGQIAMGENSDNTGTGSSVLGLSNTASGNFSTVAGGQFNDIQADYAAILGGYADTIFIGADLSYLFGIGSTLSSDSTFMVDMPHIRFGDEATGYEFPIMDGAGGQVLVTDGAGHLVWSDADLDADGIWFRDGASVTLANLGDLVAIGDVDPTEKFEVDGNVKVHGSVLVGDDLNFDDSTPEINSPELLTLNVPEGLFISDEIGEKTPPQPQRFINTSTGAYLSEDGIWVNAGCDDFAKGSTTVDIEALLTKLATLPIKQWNLETKNGEVIHIGPSADDFYALFGLGTDSSSISTIDPAGIAFAAIQALYQKTQAYEQQAGEIEQLQTEMAELKAQMQQLVDQRQEN